MRGEAEVRVRRPKKLKLKIITVGRCLIIEPHLCSTKKFDELLELIEANKTGTARRFVNDEILKALVSIKNRLRRYQQLKKPSSRGEE